jgi:hypothetical protein
LTWRKTPGFTCSQQERVNHPYSVNEYIGDLATMLAGRQAEIHAKRDLKLEEARKRRQIRREKDA